MRCKSKIAFRILALLVWIATTTYCPSANAQKGCPPGTVKVGEREERPEPNVIVVHPVCQQLMPEAAGDLVHALDLVAEHMKLSKASLHNRALYDLRCQEFFRTLGDELQREGKPSWNGSFKQGVQARGIILQIRKDSTHWEQLEGSQEQIWQRAQELANAGNIVVGGYVPIDKRLHGHLAVVMPIPSDFDRTKLENPGTGPFVRDGNDHSSQTTGNTYPLGYGAASASKAMPLSSKTTHWYVWNGVN